MRGGAYLGAEGMLWNSRLSSAWHRFRAGAAAAITIAGLLLASVWGWWGGFFTAFLAIVPLCDAMVSIRSGRRTHPFRSIALDTTAIGLAMLIVGVEPVAVGAPFLYMVLVATIFLPLRHAVISIVYAASWSAAAALGLGVSTTPVPVSPGMITGIANAVFAGHIVALLAVMARAAERSAFAQADALAEARRAIESKDQFLASISHELRTPLTSVVGFANLLVERGLGGDVAEMVDMVAREAHEVEYIVEDLLVAARADVGTLALVFEKVELCKAVAASMVSLGERVPVILTHGDDVAAVADLARVRQIIRVLLSNAFRHGGPKVAVELGASDTTVTIGVSDDGAGIPEGEIERIFAPYQRAHSTIGQPQAMGLGLHVARQLARLMGGDLAYIRRDGRTVFMVTLPRFVEAAGIFELRRQAKATVTVRGAESVA